MHLALVGTPNSGKTALFNALTGSRQKVANYPGVTVERKEGSFVDAAGPQRRRWSICPAPIRCAAAAPTRRSPATSCSAALPARRCRTCVLCVADATNLRLALRLVLELKQRRPAADAGAQHVRHRHAPRRRRSISTRLSEALGVPVVTSVAVRKRRHRRAAARGSTRSSRRKPPAAMRPKHWQPLDGARAARRPARSRPHHRAPTVSLPTRPDTLTARIDAVLLHPVAGLVDPARASCS